LWHWGNDHLVATFQAQPPDLQALRLAAMHGLDHLVALSLPLLGVAAGASVVTQSLQAQGVLLRKRAQSGDGVGRLIQGARRLLNARSITGLAVHWIAAAMFLGLCWAGWRKHAGSLVETLGRIPKAQQLSVSLAWQLAWLACWVGLALGAVDWLISNRFWLWRLRVSRAEQLREHRQAQGDPRWKAERHRVHQLTTAEPSSTALSDVTLVVHAGFQLAIALRYVAAEMAAPRVVRIERGVRATRLVDEFLWIDAARIIQHAPLARALARTELGAPIAEVLYAQVAELLGTMTTR
jgi:type III secretion protein U